MLLILVFSMLRADVLFEGYSRILSGSVQVGYVISKYEFDSKKKEFISTYFLKTTALGGSVTESLKARAKEDFTPVSYQYTSLVGNKQKSIDAQVKGMHLSATVTVSKPDGSGKPEVQRVEKDLPKGAFFSTFLGYVMLKSPQGITMSAKYDYKAVAEEDAEVFDGVAYVKNQEDYSGSKAYRILNEYKKARFISFVTSRGEILATRAPSQAIATELVSQPNEATGGQALPVSTLKILFGDVPMGLENELARQKKSEGDKLLIAPEPGKAEGVPPSKGIIIKTKKK